MIAAFFYDFSWIFSVLFSIFLLSFLFLRSCCKCRIFLCVSVGILNCIQGRMFKLSLFYAWFSKRCCRWSFAHKSVVLLICDRWRMTNKNAYKVSIFVFMTRFLFGYFILGACRRGKKVIIYCKNEIEPLTFQASKDAEYKTSKVI